MWGGAGFRRKILHRLDPRKHQLDPPAHNKVIQSHLSFTLIKNSHQQRGADCPCGLVPAIPSRLHRAAGRQWCCRDHCRDCARFCGQWSSFHLFFVADGGTFALRHNGYHACGIPDEDTIVMTGGGDPHDYVTR